MENPSDVQAFTDGSCIGNPGPGGWAVLLRWQGEEKLFSGGEAHTTNNRMELQAVIEALKALKRDGLKVEISTDSQYVMKAFTEGWLDNWLARGWKTASKSEVKNKDLWIELLELSKKQQIQWVWVKGHSGHRENEIVDEEAQKQARTWG